jgi:REP element-mobilizing transposase RayT
MNTYTPNIHHRKTIRLKGYDYSQNGMYFITICCADRQCIFGQITEQEMTLNQFGQIAYNKWLNTINLRNNVVLDHFIIMPNHMHAIIHLKKPDIKNISITQTTDNLNMCSDLGVCNTPLRSPSNNIGAIIRGYKAAVTKQFNQLDFSQKVWQRNYYEHIIRNEKSYMVISDYIINNPRTWENDLFHIDS